LLGVSIGTSSNATNTGNPVSREQFEVPQDNRGFVEAIVSE
jgi:hypothetical protein